MRVRFTTEVLIKKLERGEKISHNIQRMVIINGEFYMTKFGAVQKWLYKAGGRNMRSPRYFFQSAEFGRGKGLKIKHFGNWK